MAVAMYHLAIELPHQLPEVYLAVAELDGIMTQAANFQP
jgi:hypothetical protein